MNARAALEWPLTILLSVLALVVAFVLVLVHAAAKERNRRHPR